MKIKINPEDGHSEFDIELLDSEDGDKLEITIFGDNDTYMYTSINLQRFRELLAKLDCKPD